MAIIITIAAVVFFCWAFYMVARYIGPEVALVLAALSSCSM